jgi:hypothetical protein
MKSLKKKLEKKNNKKKIWKSLFSINITKQILPIHTLSTIQFLILYFILHFIHKNYFIFKRVNQFTSLTISYLEKIKKYFKIEIYK